MELLNTFLPDLTHVTLEGKGLGQLRLGYIAHWAFITDLACL